jgi:hypothetical protein
MFVRRLVAGGLLGAALTAASPGAAWSLSKEAIRPMLIAARERVRQCALEHALPDGRYAVWIVVSARGRGKVEVRTAPAGLSQPGRRCVERAYRAQIYPRALEATVAWSAASPPRATYSIAYPFELRVRGYGFSAEQDPLMNGALDRHKLRPRPARGP